MITHSLLIPGNTSSNRTEVTFKCLARVSKVKVWLVFDRTCVSEGRVGEETGNGCNPFKLAKTVCVNEFLLTPNKHAAPDGIMRKDV